MSAAARTEFTGSLAVAAEAIGACLERELAEERLKRIRQELEATEQSFSMMAHDLRTPLTAARIAAEAVFLRKDPVLAEKLLPRVLASIDRTSSLTCLWLDSRLVLSREGIPLRPESVELVSLVRSTVAALASEQSSRCVIECETTELYGTYDAEALRRALENLVTNAIKYGHSNTPITIRVARHKGSGVVISVHNFGGELSEQEQKTLFQWFARTDAARSSRKSGWGLGLMVVRAVAEGHGGTISVDSAPERGTTFTLTLPARA